MSFTPDLNGVLTHTNDLTAAMQDLLNEKLKGKRFIYRSKYGGETFGVIDWVGVSQSITWDSDRLKTFNRKDKIKPEPIPVTNPYSAYRPQIRIKSTTGVTYEFDEIFIIKD